MAEQRSGVNWVVIVLRAVTVLVLAAQVARGGLDESEIAGMAIGIVILASVFAVMRIMAGPGWWRFGDKDDV